RRTLSRPRLRRLTALSRRSPPPRGLPLLRRSDLGLCPRFVVAQNGIEDGQQLAHRGDEGEAGRVAGSAPTAIEALERRIMLDRDQAGHVERGADLDTAPLDLALAAKSAAVPVYRGDTGQGSDLVAIDLAELGQLGDQSAGDDIADAGHALQE